jgi:putative nucleotidyltransferase with HDIG domain
MNRTQIDIDFLRSLRVLYVEDEPEVREELARFLRRRFAYVELAADGADGLARFGSDGFDVVVTDVRMPVMDGLEMARQIKASREEMPVVVVTAYNESDYLMRAIDIGVDSYVRKPVDPNVLIQAIYKATVVRFRERQLEQSRRELLELLTQTIGSLACAIEKRDPYTDGHQKRVSRLAVAIAEKMGLSEQSINAIHLGALIHDVGKVYVPAELLARPGRLSEAEFALIRSHPVIGAEIVAGLKTTLPLAQCILQHHERLDGSGYPNGLQGEQIAQEARIIAVADVVEAMCSHRPYRPALGLEAAMTEIQDKRGIYYDPQVVDICLEVLKERGTAALDDQAGR